MNGKHDPEEVSDPDRKLLTLKTHDGLDFYSYYYLPKNYDPKKEQKVVVLLRGGTSSWINEPEENHFFEDPEDTIGFLRENGYTVVLANTRGRRRMSKEFRLTGVGGRVHDNGTRDFVSILDGLSKEVKIDKDSISTIGHSRGGAAAAIFATRLSDVSSDYKIAKTITNAGDYDPVDSIYGSYKIPDYNTPAYKAGNYDAAKNEDMDATTDPEDFLYFVDDDWMAGALNHRPEGKFTDKQWARIQEIEKEHFTKWQEDNLDRPIPLNNTQGYFNDSAYHHAEKLQGKVLALCDPDRDRPGFCGTAMKMEKRVGPERMKVITHDFDHMMPSLGYLREAEEAEYLHLDTIKRYRRGINLWRTSVLEFLKDD